MNKPSSTITAAALAMSAVVLLFELVLQFGPKDMVLRPTLVAATTAFIGALAGYFKKETVLPTVKKL